MSIYSILITIIFIRIFHNSKTNHKFIHASHFLWLTNKCFLRRTHIKRHRMFLYWSKIVPVGCIVIILLVLVRFNLGRWLIMCYRLSLCRLIISYILLLWLIIRYWGRNLCVYRLLYNWSRSEWFSWTSWISDWLFQKSWKNWLLFFSLLFMYFFFL